MALVDGVPRTVNLQEALQAWLDHQVVVVTRRTQFRLEKAEARLHIVEGLREGARHDRRDREGDPRVEGPGRGARRADGRSAFGFSEIQANHILDMALGRLTQLGREELAKEKQGARRDDQGAEAHPRQARRADGRDPRGARRDPRRAQGAAPHRRSSTDDAGTIDVVALVEDEPYVVTVTARGYVRAVPERARRPQVANAGERDAIAQVIDTTALAGVLFFTDRGRAYRATVHELPEGAAHRRAEPVPVRRRRAGRRGARRARCTRSIPNLVFVTARGGVKRTALAEFAEASGRKDGIVAMKLAADDRVVAVFPGWDDYELLLVTAQRPGHPVRRGRGASGRPQRRAASAASG